MKVVVNKEYKGKLIIEDILCLEVGINDVLVKIVVCGVCYIDLYVCYGDWLVKLKMLLVLGYEGVGIIEKVGVNIKYLLVGDCVGVFWLYSVCGYCEFCLEGKEILCFE